MKCTTKYGFLLFRSSLYVSSFISLRVSSITVILIDHKRIQNLGWKCFPKIVDVNCFRKNALA